MGGKARRRQGVHRLQILDTPGLVIVLTLGKQLQQVQRPLLALIGLDVLEHRCGFAVLRDDDRAVPIRRPGDQFGGAPLEGCHGLDVLLQVHAPTIAPNPGP